MSDIMRIRSVVTGFSGAPGYTNFYFAPILGPVTAEKAEEAAQRVSDAWTSAPLLHPPGFTWEVEQQVDVLNDVDGEVSDTFVNAGVHTGIGTGLSWGPLSAGGLITWHTGTHIAGRALKGRTFMVPLSAGSSADGGLDSGITAVFATFVNSMLDAGAVPTVDFVVWSRPRAAGSGKDHDLPARDGSSSKVISGAVGHKFAVLRSRRD